MAMNIVSLMLVASTLITAISVDSLQTNGLDKRAKELFDKLNQIDRTGAEAKEMLEQVDVEERDKLMLGNCSVSDILKYQDTLCTLERLYDPYFLIDRCSNAKQYNRGVASFIHLYVNQRTRSCAEKFYSIFKDALGKLEPRDEETVRELQSRLNTKVRVPSVNGHSFEKSTENQRLESCIRVIRQLSTAMSFGRRRYVELWGEERDVIEHWYGLLETCRRHTEKQCKPYYSPEDSSPFWSPIETNKKKRNDENVELKTKCHEIVNKVASDETIEERVAKSAKHYKNHKESRTFQYLGKIFASPPKNARDIYEG